MELKQLEVFSERSNYGIVRMPDRSFPGCVIQGDSLAILFEAARECHQRAALTGDSELTEELAALVEALDDRLRHYEQVLADHGIERPYNRSAG